MNFKHGHTRDAGSSRTYTSWRRMRARCLTPTDPHYPDYGGRGITICPEWDSFERFLADMGERPPGKTLDREKVNEGYSKPNCRWATTAEQNRNRTDTVHVTYDGRTACMAEWARETGIGTTTLCYRINRGWDVEKALTTPVRKQNFKEARC